MGKLVQATEPGPGIKEMKKSSRNERIFVPGDMNKSVQRMRINELKYCEIRIKKETRRAFSIRFG